MKKKTTEKPGRSFQRMLERDLNTPLAASSRGSSQLYKKKKFLYTPVVLSYYVAIRVM